jgi:chloride channel 2
MIKKLPYLPDIIPSSSGAYNIFVESFMMKVGYHFIMQGF